MLNLYNLLLIFIINLEFLFEVMKVYNNLLYVRIIESLKHHYRWQQHQAYNNVKKIKEKEKTSKKKNIIQII